MQNKAKKKQNNRFHLNKLVEVNEYEYVDDEEIFEISETHSIETNSNVNIRSYFPEVWIWSEPELFNLRFI